MKNHPSSPERTPRQPVRRARHNAIAAAAAAMAGSSLDLDPNLETAAVEPLVQAGLKRGDLSSVAAMDLD